MEIVGNHLPAKVSCSDIQALGQTIGMAKSQGLPIMQKVGHVVSSVDGHSIDFILRRYGYNTSVCKNSLNLNTDIIDPGDEAYSGLLDGEVFLIAMKEKLKDKQTQGIFVKRLALNE